MSAAANASNSAQYTTELKLVSEIDHEFWESSHATGFKSPEHNASLRFTDAELAGSVARLSAHSDADIQVVETLIASFLHKLDAFMSKDGEVFSINEKVLGLADAARTAFSAEVGVGFCDLYMTSLGYAYRANARKLIPRGIVGDFLYDGTPTLNAGVVLVEGKGSIGGRSTMKHVRRMTRGGYKKQVDRHVGTHRKGVSILHGYAIGVGARPGRADSYVHVVETAITSENISDQSSRSTGPQAPSSTGPQVRIGLDNYRAVFSLMRASRTVTAIDAAQKGDFASLVNMAADEFRVLRWRGSEYVVVQTSAPLQDQRTFKRYAVRRELVTALWEQLPRAALGVSRADVRLKLPQWPAALARNREIRDAGAEFPDGFAYISRNGFDTGAEENWTPKHLSVNQERLEEILAELSKQRQFQYA